MASGAFERTVAQQARSPVRLGGLLSGSARFKLTACWRSTQKPENAQGRPPKRIAAGHPCSSRGGFFYRSPRHLPAKASRLLCRLFFSGFKRSSGEGRKPCWDIRAGFLVFLFCCLRGNGGAGEVQPLGRSKADKSDKTTRGSPGPAQKPRAPFQNLEFCARGRAEK